MRSVDSKTRQFSTRGLRPVHVLIFAAVFNGAIVAGTPRQFLDQYCVTCHNQKLHTAGLALDNQDVSAPGANPEVWERVIAKLRAGSMPPPGVPRADPATYRDVASVLEKESMSFR